MVKFICKDFWSAVYKKQVDTLRTNHQGVYVLQDNKFRFLNQLSANKQYLEQSPKSQQCVVNVQYLAFACGMIRGALANLGLKSIVSADVEVMPMCKSRSLPPQLPSAMCRVCPGKFQVQVQRI
ncbi:TRAPPC6B [Cordylochernes scorpioides]|uniref:TRAPPC6B n=1 Tax=Cordylochernes scorpioides TaxID=51811 RepID=A0ABY6K4S1_9ARAC|nr:TRAPPC6B [Cordylochernes scorpioides]